MPSRLLRAVLLLALPLAALPNTLLAQGDIRLGLGAGITVPLRSYGDVVDKGWMGNANLTFFPAASAAIGFRLDGLYGRSSLSAISGHQTQVGGTANIVFQFGARRSPNRFYLFGGGGYVKTTTSSPNFGKLSDTNPALDAGAGFSFGVRSLALFVEARYLNVYTDGVKPQYAPLLAGVTFGGF